MNESDDYKRGYEDGSNDYAKTLAALERPRPAPEQELHVYESEPTNPGYEGKVTVKKFSVLREEMSPESRARASQRTEEMLAEMGPALPAPEPPEPHLEREGNHIRFVGFVEPLSPDFIPSHLSKGGAALPPQTAREQAEALGWIPPITQPLGAPQTGNPPPDPDACPACGYTSVTGGCALCCSEEYKVDRPTAIARWRGNL